MTGHMSAKPTSDLDSNDEDVANVSLIAEAFNVFHETGLTPRQLADKMVEQRTDLEKVLTHLIRWHDQISKTDLDMARAALAKSKGVQS